MLKDQWLAEFDFDIATQEQIEVNYFDPETVDIVSMKMYISD